MRCQLCTGIYFLLFAFQQFEIPLGAESLPDDASFFVADLKYNEIDGVKICEIQQGALAVFSGYDHLNGTEYFVENAVANYLLQFKKPIFFIDRDVRSAEIAQLLKEGGARNFASSEQLFADQEFLAASLKSQENENGYQCLLLAKPRTTSPFKEFTEKYPGVLIVDAASFPFWIDKYKMSLLFSGDPILEAIKPAWGIYKKKYQGNLAEDIIKSLGGDQFVIKPIGSFLGNGVLIVDKDNLEDALKYVVTRIKPPITLQNRIYSYWSTDIKDSFIVEKFYGSDPVKVPHLRNELYDGTVRIAFFLSYKQKEITFKTIEMHWKLPAIPVTDKGSLNEMHLSIGKMPYFAEIEPEIQARIENQLMEALPVLYMKMLDTMSSQDEKNEKELSELKGRLDLLVK